MYVAVQKSAGDTPSNDATRVGHTCSDLGPYRSRTRTYKGPASPVPKSTPPGAFLALMPRLSSADMEMMEEADALRKNLIMLKLLMPI
eukprot:scaffold625_cov324-Pavlova_lutheri.AAC.15